MTSWLPEWPDPSDEMPCAEQHARESTLATKEAEELNASAYREHRRFVFAARAAERVDRAAGLPSVAARGK